MTASRRLILFAAVGNVLALLQLPVSVLASDTFPPIAIVSGFAPGGGDSQGGSARGASAMSLRPRPVYDLSARLYARHFRRFLPGKPDVKLQHMPGAGSLRAARWLLHQSGGAKIALGLFSGQALRELSFDGASNSDNRLTAIGGRAWGEYICASQDISVLKKSPNSAALIFGATAPRERTYLHARAYAEIATRAIRIVPGYANTSQIALAFRRREINAFCGMSISEVTSQLGDLMQSGGLRPLVRFAPEGANGLRSVSRAHAAYVQPDPARSKSAASRAIALLEAQGAIETAMVARPRLAAGHTAILRAAFTAMLADQKFRRDAVRWGLRIDPVAATAIEAGLRDMAAADARAKAVIRRWAKPQR